MKKDPRFINSYTDDSGNRISQYDLLKSAASTVEEKREFEDIELKDLHKRIIRYSDQGFIQDNGFGDAIVAKGNFNDMYKNNRAIRSEVKKILKTDSETNKFFRSKDINKYLKFRNKKDRPFETLLDNVKKPIEVKTPSPQYQQLELPLNLPKQSPAKVTKKEEDSLPYFMKPGYKPDPDPDLEKGLGSLLGVKNET
jgi:hypothetical protein